jgi:hypothetical protein
MFGLYVLKHCFLCVGCDVCCGSFFILNFYELCVVCVLRVMLVVGCKVFD